MGTIRKNWKFDSEVIEKLEEIKEEKHKRSESDLITDLILNEHKKINRVKRKG